ncbi:MAG: DUF192 domain-containing protein [Eggerthellaceae bacterium]|nr:DUF192 domain-containing protein [Eggerthellaceae bacterium]
MRLATSMAARMRGLLGREPGSVGVLLLAPCHDIHTFGMSHPIDVAFVDAAGVVLEAHRDVGPRRRLRCRGAAAVLERFAEAGPWPVPGDQVTVAARRDAEDGRRGGCGEGVPHLRGGAVR